MKSLQWFLEEECELVTTRILFTALYDLTNGDPCAGCYKNNSFCGCDTYERSLVSTREPTQTPVETNAQVAERLGVSKRQASKMVVRGEAKRGINGMV